MTDTAVADQIPDSLSEFLSSRRWMTPLEVWRAQARLPEAAVRRELRYLADTGIIESRIGGSVVRPVREYRAWR